MPWVDLVKTSYYGPIKNAWDLARCLVDLLSGSAASSRFRSESRLSLGFRYRGSIRQQAAFNGVTVTSQLMEQFPILVSLVVHLTKVGLSLQRLGKCPLLNVIASERCKGFNICTCSCNLLLLKIEVRTFKMKVVFYISRRIPWGRDRPEVKKLS